MNSYTINSIIILIFVRIGSTFGIIIQILSCQFLENGNRYRIEIFGVNLFFNRLSNDISHFVVAQNFIISTCLRYVDIANFLEDYNRYNDEFLNIH